MTWRSWPLVELCEINIGRTPSRNSPEYWGAGWPWLSIADMNQGRRLRHTKEQISSLAASSVMGSPVAPGTVALSFKLSIGKVGIIDVPMFTNEAIATLPIRASNMITPEFLYWALRSVELTRDTDDAVMGKTLNKEKLARIQVPVPPLEDQRRIAVLLDRADALQVKRRGAIMLLYDLGQSIFLDMFGDPGSNPKGWPKSRFVSLFEEPLRNGLSPSKGGPVEAKVLTLSSITGSEFDSSAWKFSGSSKLTGMPPSPGYCR